MCYCQWYSETLEKVFHDLTTLDRRYRLDLCTEPDQTGTEVGEGELVVVILNALC